MAFKTKTIAIVTGVNQQLLEQDNVRLAPKDYLLISNMKFPFRSKVRVSRDKLYLLIQEWNSPAWWDADFFKYELEFPELTC